MEHDNNCQCVRCSMVRGYEAMSDINLEIATTYQQLESEAEAVSVDYAKTA